MLHNCKVKWLLLACFLTTLAMSGCGGNDKKTSVESNNDVTAPVITLNGDNIVELTQGSNYEDAGATAIDNIDGSVSVVSNTSLDTTVVGEYSIIYTATDTAGNSVTVTRIINVNLPIVTISGYVEDDAIPNATVIISDSNGNQIIETATDANGLYSIDTGLITGQTYNIEIEGTLVDKSINMHSSFIFSGDDSNINVNPLTELKYQLVKENNQTLADAEILVRNYFNIFNGVTLENVRFSTTDKAYIGLQDVAEIYDGNLPIEAIIKVKADIVRNDISSSEKIKDYSYKSLVAQNIELEVSATSLALNEELTVSIQGVETLNESYTLVWNGIPEEGVTGSNFSKTFTVSEFAQDLYISATLYQVIDDQKTYVSSASENINFYEPLAEISSIVTDSTIDNEYSISNALQMKVPAGTLADGVEIKVTELQTNSDTTLAQFSINSNAGDSEAVIIEYNYDPYQVTEPRNLQVTLQGDDPKVINVSDIDYVNHTIKFEVPLALPINRSFNNLFETTVMVEGTSEVPSNVDIAEFLDEYQDYIAKIINNSVKLRDSVTAENMVTYLEGETIARSKLIKVLKEIDSSTGDYKFNILARAINNIIAYETAEELNKKSTTWVDSLDSLERFNDLKCNSSIAASETSGHTFNPWDCSSLKESMVDKMVDANLIISRWVGNIKLTDAQQNFLKFSKSITSLAASVATGQVYGIILTAEGEAFSYIDGDTYGGDEFGYAYGASLDLLNTIKDQRSAFELQNYVISYGINQFFNFAAENMKQSSAERTAPIFLQLYKYQEELNYLDDSGNVFAYPYISSLFRDDFFPDRTEGGYEFYHYNHIQRRMSEGKGFGTYLDPAKRLEKIMLFNTPEQGYISNQERGFAIALLKYAFGDVDAGQVFNELEVKKAYAIGSLILNQAYFMPDSEVQTVESSKYFDFNTLSTTYERKSVISSEYTLTDSEIIKNWFRSNNTNKLQEISNFASLEYLMQKAKLTLSNTQLSSLNIKEIKIETYGVGLEFSTEDNTWLLDEGDKVNHTFKNIDSINQQFVFNDESGKNELSFAILFDGEDFTQFDNKLVGFKILLTYEKSGIDKVESADFVFTTLADNENLTETNFVGATLKSSVKDAVTGNALDGAFVTLNPGGLSSFTDENGDYEVSSLAAGEYTIIISKPGYRQVEASLTLNEDETKIFEVSLSIDNESATTTGTTNVTIKDAFNGSILTSGYISLREGQNNKSGEVTQTINSGGETSLELVLFPGTYTIESGANGYTTSYSTVTIIGDTSINKEVSISPVLAEDQLRAVLTWGEFPRDLDSHLIKKIDGIESYHVYYSNQAPTNADASLDADDTSSYGPETITINNIDSSAIYTYYIYNFSGGEDSVLPDSGAKIDIYSGDISQTLFIPNQGGQYWKVFEIVNGEIVSCTQNCVRDTDDDIARSINSEALIFKNLPIK